MSRKQGLIYIRDTDNNEISFNVKRENITTERNFKINEQEMYSNNTTHHTTNFYHNGDDGLTFNISAIFTKSEADKMKLIDAWYREMRPFKIVFDKHLNIKLPLVKKKWIITKLSFKQEADTVTEWDITFRTYNPPKQIKAIKNDLPNRASKSYKWTHNCKKSYKKLTYKKMKKKKKGNDCAKLLNKILIELGYMKKAKKKVKTGKKDKKGNAKKKKVKYVPDKCTKDTKKAVKLFKEDWNRYKLTPKLKKKGKSKKGNKIFNDKIDKNTYIALGNYKQLKAAKKKK